MISQFSFLFHYACAKSSILSITVISLSYSMFHVTWSTFKFNRNQLGTVSAMSCDYG